MCMLRVSELELLTLMLRVSEAPRLELHCLNLCALQGQ